MVNLKKIKILVVAIIILFTPSNIYASNMEDILIDQISTQEEGVWYPERVESKDFYIINNKENNIIIEKLYIQLESCKNLKKNQLLDIGSRQFKELSTNSTVKLYYKDKLLFQDKLYNLLSEKGVALEEKVVIESNGKELLNMTIDMDKNMNNDAQDLENIFSIGVSYKIYKDELVTSDFPINTDKLVNSYTDMGGSSDEILPQTGGIINSFSLIVLGILIIVVGISLNRKSS